MENPKQSSFALFYVTAMVAVVACVFAGLAMLRQSHAGEAMIMMGAALLTAGCVGMIGFLIVMPIMITLNDARQNELKHQEELMSSLGDRLQGISVLMNLISEQQLLSDRAKQVAFREKDADVVRRAIQEEISRQDWEAALLLAKDIEVGFGYKQEADRFREEIISKRDEIQRRRMAELLAPVDRHIKTESWGAALQEAQRIMEQLPDDPQVQRLPEEIENRRQMRKQQLRDSWQEAVNRHDVDGSIEILKRLDLYLTPAEAESMQEIARNVFKEKRETLRTRFALAVQEHNWLEALRLGDEIINDFPNTRIAQEVREKMETLRNRAVEPEPTAQA